MTSKAMASLIAIKWGHLRPGLMLVEDKKLRKGASKKSAEALIIKVVEYFLVASLQNSKGRPNFFAVT